MLMTAIALVAMVSCNKDDNKNKGNKGNGGNNETEDLITIDGNLDEWASIKGAATAELDEAFAYPGLQVMKAIADETNIYVYFEYELQDAVDTEEPQTNSPFEIFVDSDDNATTGGYTWLWGDAEDETYKVGYEYMLESEAGWLEGTKVVDMSESMNIYNFDGVDGVDAWGEGGHLTQLQLNSFCESAGKVVDGMAFVEVAVLRSVVNCSKPGKCNIGIVAYSTYKNDKGETVWPTTGVLPQGAAAGAERMLEVALP